MSVKKWQEEGECENECEGDGSSEAENEDENVMRKMHLSTFAAQALCSYTCTARASAPEHLNNCSHLIPCSLHRHGHRTVTPPH